MKRKVLAIALCIVVVLLLFFACDEWRKTTLLEDVDSTTISKIVLEGPCSTSGFTVTQQKDINKVVELVQSMKLKWKIPAAKDGYGFALEVYYKSGETDAITLTSEDVAVNSPNFTYQCDRNYCEDFDELYKELSKESKN